MSLNKEFTKEDGTVMLWVIAIFSISLFVLAALFSVSNYFSNAMEWQSKVEMAVTNASDQIDLSSFEKSGEISDIAFDSSGMLRKIQNELQRHVSNPEKIVVKRWKVEGGEVWIHLSYPWTSPLGEFDVLPKDLEAKVHLTLDSQRHLR